MNTLEAVRIALQSLWANKLRSILTLLGVVIAVATVIAVETFVNGINGYVAEKIFNLGADVPYSVNELAREVQRAIGKETGTVHLPERNEVLHAFSDHSRSREVFGASATVTLPDGLRRMAEWVKKTGTRQGKPFGKIEIDRELPESWKKLCTTGRP